MELKEILAISGKGGLFKYISQARNGIIVESFEDKKRQIIHSSTKVSALEDIAIYTENDELPLADVLKKIFEKEEGKEALSPKSSSDELKSYFESVLEDYDKDRVYVSDIKKIINWYNLLVKYDLLHPEKEEEEKKEDNAEKETKKADAGTKPKTAKASAKTNQPKGGSVSKTAAKTKAVKPGTTKGPSTKQK